MPAAEADERVDEALAQVGLVGICRRLSARIVRRHEDAGVAGARAGHRSRYSADGRAVRRARRDHALSPQQRSAGAVAQAAHDRHLRHPFGVRVGVSVAARDRDVAAARAHQCRISHRHAGAAGRGFPDVGRLCRLLPRSLEGADALLCGAAPAHELLHAILFAILLPVVVLAAGHRAVGARGARQRHPALCAAGTVSGVPDAGRATGRCCRNRSASPC